MSTYNESQHERSRDGKWTEMGGSAPESALTAPAEEMAAAVSSGQADSAESRRSAALTRYWEAEEALYLADGQYIASAVRDEHPSAVSVELSDEGEGYEPMTVTLADGSTVDIDSDSELYGDLRDCTTDLNSSLSFPWFTTNRDAATVHFDKLPDAEGTEPTSEPKSAVLPAELQTRIRTSLDTLSDAAATFAEETNNGEESSTRSYEDLEDARLRFADEAETLLADVLAAG